MDSEKRKFEPAWLDRWERFIWCKGDFIIRDGSGCEVSIEELKEKHEQERKCDREP